LTSDEDLLAGGLGRAGLQVAGGNGEERVFGRVVQCVAELVLNVGVPDRWQGVAGRDVEVTVPASANDRACAVGEIDLFEVRRNCVPDRRQRGCGVECMVA
jgi:hypothetical protein